MFRFFPLFCLFLFPLMMVTPLSAGSSVVIPLSGEWDYIEGFSLETLSGAPREWKKTIVPGFLPELPNNNSYTYNGSVTVRVPIPAEAVSGLRNGEAWFLSTGFTSDVVKVYCNETFLSQAGEIEPYHSGYRSVRTYYTDSCLRNNNNYFYIHIYAPTGSAIHILDPGAEPETGPAEILTAKYNRDELINYALLAIYFVVGAYHLQLFNKRRKEVYNLFFGLFAVLLASYWFSRTHTAFEIFSSAQMVRKKFEYIVLFNLGQMLLFFLTHYFLGKYSKTAFGFSVLGLGLSITALAGNHWLMDKALLVWQISALPLMLYLIFFIIREAWQGKRDAYFLATGVILLMLAGVNDILVSNGLIKSVHVGRFFFLFFVIGIAGLLANRFMKVHNEVEELNYSLEQKVVDRTRELQQSLETVRALSNQQHGDYFLTSLLLKPLNRNYVASDFFSVDFFIRQKKKFEFKDKQHDIGGDLCTAHSIVLEGKKYIAFLNADAMGKSVQGAGGALVLGAVFYSIVERTQVSAVAADISPERWLKNTFLELHKVFESFDGSMLISMAMGLIEENSGFLYYINAEHPWTILYRDGKASFIETELQFRKLGMTAVTGGIYVQTLQLAPDDILICGSDGRDDFLITQNDEKIMNEDETIILKTVESAKADLSSIYEKTANAGEISDDFSLLKIHFHGRGPVIVKQRREDANKAYLEKDYKTAVEHGMAYLEGNPADTDFLRFLARANKLAGNIDKALDLAERVRIRRPADILNLLNLIHLYLLKNNISRAEKLWEDAAKIEPGNQKLARFKEVITNQKR